MAHSGGGVFPRRTNGMVGGVKRRVEGKIGGTVISMATVDSTNTVAMELGEGNAPHGTVVVADYQTKGRGRLGRTWVSPDGNIYMSIVLRPAVALADPQLLTLAASIACARVLREASNFRVEIKWPNDLMLSGKKLGGILTEMKSRGGKVLFAVVGIGINLNSDIDDFPAELETIATSVMIETGEKTPKSNLISRICDELGTWYDALMRGEREDILDEWRHLSSTLGRRVRITSCNETIEGVAEGLDGAGRLIVKLPSGLRRVISAGDVTMVR